jgi:predicted GTPase
MVHNIFENSSSKISRSLINSLIEEAIKNSSAKDLPEDMRSKVSFLFLKKSKDP